MIVRFWGRPHLKLPCAGRENVWNLWLGKVNCDRNVTLYAETDAASWQSAAVVDRLGGGRTDGTADQLEWREGAYLGRRRLS